MKALMDRGAEFETKTDNGWTPLMLAALKGHADVVHLLLSSASSVDARNEQGRTALDYAEAGSNHEVARLIKNYNAIRRR